MLMISSRAHAFARRAIAVAACIALSEAAASAQANNDGLSQGVLEGSILKDRDGDGVVRIVAFGDSLTRGTGDGNQPGEEIEVITQPEGEAGFPLRIELALSVPVLNRGVPGEVVTETGVSRLAGIISSLPFDVVTLGGGANDSRAGRSAFAYSTTMQTLLNIAYASGKSAVLITIPPITGNHQPFRFITDLYNAELRTLGRINGVPVADIDRAFKNTCGTGDDCNLLNLPEGLHPNIVGYDVAAEAVEAALLNIDLFGTGGPGLLAEALGVPASDITTRQDPSTAAATGTKDAWE